MRITLRSAAAAAVLAAAAINLSSTAAAHDGPPTGECHFRGAGGYGGLPGPEGMPEHDGHGMGWGHHMAMLGGAPLPPWLHPLHLSEAQQASVFKLMHEQEPGLREHFKAVHASREALHRSALTAGTDPARLRTLADASGKADAELAMLMAQTDQQLLQILTPEQKKSLQDCLPKAGS